MIRRKTLVFSCLAQVMILHPANATAISQSRCSSWLLSINTTWTATFWSSCTLAKLCSSLLIQQSLLWLVMSKYNVSFLNLHSCDRRDEHEPLNNSWNNWNGTHSKCPYNSQTNLIIHFNQTTVLEYCTACQEYYVEPAWMNRTTSSCSLFCKENHLLEFPTTSTYIFSNLKTGTILESTEHTSPGNYLHPKHHLHKFRISNVIWEKATSYSRVLLQLVVDIAKW